MHIMLDQFYLNDKVLHFNKPVCIHCSYFNAGYCTFFQGSILNQSQVWLIYITSNYMYNMINIFMCSFCSVQTIMAYQGITNTWSALNKLT